MLKNLIPTPSTLHNRAPSGVFAGQRHRTAAKVLIVISGLILLSAVVFAPMYHVQRYNESAGPIVEQLQNEAQIMRSQTLDGSRKASNDYGAVIDSHNKQLLQIESSRLMLENLRKNLKDVHVGIGATGRHASVVELMTLFERVLDGNKKSFEVRRQIAESMQRFARSQNRAIASIKDGSVTVADTIKIVGQGIRAADTAAKEIKAIDTGDDLRTYAELAAKHIEMVSSGFTSINAALKRKDFDAYAGLSKSLDARLLQSNKALKAEMDKVFASSQLARMFDELDAKLRKVSEQLK